MHVAKTVTTPSINQRSL